MFLLSLFHRSKRGVENKADYDYSKGERWPVAMVKKRLSLLRAEYSPGTREGENYIKVSRYFDRLCFVHQLDANLLYVN